MKKYDVAIIGAGTSGLTARREVMKVTDNYVVIDDGILGTTCARVGCMPSKVLIQVAEDFHRRHSFNEEGILNGEELGLDSAKVMSHVQKLRDRFVRGVTGSMKSWEDTHLKRKRAVFIDEHTLDLGDEKIQADKIIIATGSSPFIPKELEEYKDFLITTDQIFEEEKLPESIAVIGLGVIGIELGQAFSRLGVKTLGIARRRNIAGITDPKVNEYITSYFEKNMNISFSGIDKVEKHGDKVLIKSADKELITDKILVTTGRAPNLKSLKLENAKIEVNEKGIPLFDERTFSLKSQEHIFLAGDVNTLRPILHEASDMGRIAGFNAVKSKKEFSLRAPLAVTFSDPNIAMAGQSYKKLKEAKIDFEVGEVLFEGQGRSIVKLKEVGMLRIYGEKKTGKILGAELMAPSAEHLAHLISWAIQLNLTVNEMLSLPFYHPVVEEGLRTSLRDLQSKVGCTIPELEVPHF